MGITFNKFFEDKMNDEKAISPGTYRGYKRCINKLNQYNKNILFSEINYSFVKDLDNFMIGQGLKINSRANIHIMVKKFLNVAIACNIIGATDMPYNTQIGGGAGKFKIPTEEGTKIPLSFEERERIEELKYLHSLVYNRYKDAFLFMCYTGLRLSDTKNFNITHLVHSPSGYSIDLHKMIKTKRSVYLELFTLFEGKPEIILRKYLKLKYGTDNYDKILRSTDTGSIFKSIDGPNFNAHLKVIARDAKIPKHITTHCGRHTFGTQMAILTNGNQYLIMDLLGHSKPSTTMVYIKLGERMINKQLRNLDWSAYNTTPAIQTTKSTSETKVSPQKTTPPKAAANNAINPDHVLLHIYNEVLPNISFNLTEKIPFAIDSGSLYDYVGLLPFSDTDIKKYQNKPFLLSGYLIGMKYVKYLKEIEMAINAYDWLKESCLQIQLKFLPMKHDGLQVTELS